MNEEKINKSPKKLRILVAPLDWGLGHATRCVPIIQTLLKHNAEVLIAASGATHSLLKKEFPEVKMLALQGYNIRYSKHSFFFILNLITQLPKVLISIGKERKWLQKIVEDEHIDGVVSDNRPGLTLPSVPSVYITHQLQIATGNRISENWLRRLHYHFINKFQQCWIPDNETGFVLAGSLSHPREYPACSIKYLGLLSRFQKKQELAEFAILIMLSGPEPQRTILENKLLAAFDKYKGKFALVRGLPGEKHQLPLKETNAKVFNHLPAPALNDLIAKSEVVIARAGYSTVMDLVKLQKKALLIATPGQTEQEYLAGFLKARKIFATIPQKEISFENLQKALHTAVEPWSEVESRMHTEVIKDWLTSLRGN